MKNQALFSSKDKSKKLKCHLLQFLFGILRVKLGIKEGIPNAYLASIKSMNHSCFTAGLAVSNTYFLDLKIYKIR